MEERDYYQGAMAAEGEIYISSAYMDEMTGQPVVTMCKAIPSTGSFLAIDMMFSCFERNNENMKLPKNAAYYLLGREGTLLYYKSPLNHEYEEFQELVDGFMEMADGEKDNQVLENVTALEGETRNVYFHHMANGWTAILTISEREILSGLDTFNYISIVLVLLGLVVVVFQALHDYSHERQSQLLMEERDQMAGRNRIYQNAMNGTARAYRAIYYIDVENGCYEMLYPHRGKDAEAGDYNKEFVSSRFEAGMIEEEYRQQLEEFLNLSNILKQLETEDHIEFQYKRMDEEGKYEWCSAAITVAEMGEERLIRLCES